MDDLKSLKATLIFTICIFILLISIFSMWKLALTQKNAKIEENNVEVVIASEEK